MKFLFLFRGGTAKYMKMTEEETKLDYQKWGEWMGKLAEMGHNPEGLPLKYEEGTASIVSSTDIMDGPYLTDKDDKVSGYVLADADDMAMAQKMAKMCPILDVDGFVEIRECGQM